jgi:DNA-binding CsgD family transcriptional regulator
VKLTKRELEVLIELANGGTYKAIARKFLIGHSTAKKHAERMRKKLEAKNNVQAVNNAYQQGVLKIKE